MIETSRLYNSIPSTKETENIGYISAAQLVSKSGDAVYRFCLSLVYRREDADDLFQETFLRAFTKLEKINQADNRAKRRKYDLLHRKQDFPQRALLS